MDLMRRERPKCVFDRCGVERIDGKGHSAIAWLRITIRQLRFEDLVGSKALFVVAKSGAKHRCIA